MKKILHQYKIFLSIGILCCFAYTIYSFSSKGENGIEKQLYIMNKFIDQKEIVEKYSQLYNVPSRMYVSVIYGELFNNLDVYDDFDETRARLGFDPSIGFSQIRISTALWIENNYPDNIAITKSKTMKELIDKLVNNEKNIAYSIFYVSLIKKNLENEKKHITINTIASYYGKGIDFNKSIEDIHYSNKIGNTAEYFYNSNLLLTEYP